MAIPLITAFLNKNAFIFIPWGTLYIGLDLNKCYLPIYVNTLKSTTYYNIPAANFIGMLVALKSTFQ
jgi:hypothetical protein